MDSVALTSLELQNQNQNYRVLQPCFPTKSLVGFFLGRMIPWFNSWKSLCVSVWRQMFRSSWTRLKRSWSWWSSRSQSYSRNRQSWQPRRTLCWSSWRKPVMLLSPHPPHPHPHPSHQRLVRLWASRSYSATMRLVLFTHQRIVGCKVLSKFLCIILWLLVDFPWSKELQQHLKESFRLSKFRPLQLRTMNLSLSGKDLFLVMPTGRGKSLCYQLPAVYSKGKKLTYELLSLHHLCLNSTYIFILLWCVFRLYPGCHPPGVSDGGSDHVPEVHRCVCRNAECFE